MHRPLPLSPSFLPLLPFCVSSALFPSCCSQILAEADPSALDRLLQVEAVMRLRKARDDATAEALEKGAAARALADVQRQQQQQHEGGAKAAEGAAAGGPSWDAVAAYLDARVAGRVYGRGSGERHVTRLASYPAFEVGGGIGGDDGVRRGRRGRRVGRRGSRRVVLRSWVRES